MPVVIISAMWLFIRKFSLKMFFYDNRFCKSFDNVFINDFWNFVVIFFRDPCQSLKIPWRRNIQSLLWIISATGMNYVDNFFVNFFFSNAFETFGTWFTISFRNFLDNSFENFLDKYLLLEFWWNVTLHYFQNSFSSYFGNFFANSIASFFDKNLWKFIP